ncbi:hypothetical protein AGDE_16736 [Angomonas deanei]|uniref:Uncharacterized protein n=1 Tax=Angomonas deanei TaxID=59799 RepID=A0A7G2C5C3_9TRYP|nr:hypothetical protein AGDE_16736 [Angomonas deanei]CAD2213953.1 hypothetical protein, conserved [Angomonas deanei]|eukprot:EPY16313.1 hypothetical protein AGDE_16736 [Angomonas deanei]
MTAVMEVEHITGLGLINEPAEVLLDVGVGRGVAHVRELGVIDEDGRLLDGEIDLIHRGERLRHIVDAAGEFGSTANVVDTNEEGADITALVLLLRLERLEGVDTLIVGLSLRLVHVNGIGPFHFNTWGISARHWKEKSTEDEEKKINTLNG